MVFRAISCLHYFTFENPYSPTKHIKPSMLSVYAEFIRNIRIFRPLGLHVWWPPYHNIHVEKLISEVFSVFSVDIGSLEVNSNFSSPAVTDQSNRWGARAAICGEDIYTGICDILSMGLPINIHQHLVNAGGYPTWHNSGVHAGQVFLKRILLSALAKRR